MSQFLSEEPGQYRARALLWQFIALYLCFHAPSALTQDEPKIENVLQQGVFSTLFEPSGITAIGSSSYLIVEDEAAKALRRVDVLSDKGVMALDEIPITLGKGFIQRQLLGRLDDLEGAARGADNRLYVIGSHDDAYKGKLSARQKIFSFSITNQGTERPHSRHAISASLKATYPELAAGFRRGKQDRNEALNIEALAFDRKRDRLLIGLRSPRIDGDAIVVSLLNPGAFLEQDADPVWAESLWKLELEKGGLRALSYDDATDSLIAVSQRESGKSQRFKLWVIAADGQSLPRRVKSTDKDLFTAVEGIVSTDDGILFIRDDGNRRKKQRASWFLLSRQQLGIETQ